MTYRSLNLSHLDEIRALLVRLAEAEEPLDDTGLCLLCGVMIVADRTHADFCPWQQARELLGVDR